MRLRAVNPAEQHAAVASVRHDIGQLLPQLPGFVQQMVADKVNSDQGKQIIINIVDHALDAAEKARNVT